jgi:hypothetical protein
MYTTTFEKFKSAKDNLSVVLYGKQLIEEIEKMIKESSVKLVEEKELGIYNVEDCNKNANIFIKKESTINPKIIDELSDEEIRKTYKVTETALKTLGKKDLIDKYKTITEVKSLKIESIKG